MTVERLETWTAVGVGLHFNGIDGFYFDLPDYLKVFRVVFENIVNNNQYNNITFHFILMLRLS